MTDTKPRNVRISVHRPTMLCCVGVLAAAAVLLGFEVEAQAWMASLVVGMLLGLCLFLPKADLRRMITLVLAGLFAGSIAVDVGEQYVYRRLMPYADHSYRYEVSGLMLEDAELFEADTRILLRVERIDGQAVRSFKTYAYLEGLQEIEVGQRVTLALRFERPSRDSSGFDALRYYRAKGVYLMGKAAQDVKVSDESAPPLWLRPALWSKTLKNRLHTLTNERHAAVLQSLMLGDTSEIDPAYEKALRRCGLSHIMAVSGMNVVFLSNFCILLLRRKWGSIVSVPVILVFTLMTGADASVVRAALMQLIFLGAYAVRRENDSLNALMAVLALMLLANPWYLFDAGMWLSFASTLGLILVGFRVRNALERPFAKLPKLLRRVTELFTGALGATLSTMVFVLPLQLYYFKSFSLIAPLANMLLLWAVEGAFFLGMIGLLLGMIWTPLGKLCMVLAWPLVECQLQLVPRLARLPFSLIPSDAYTLIGVGVAYAFLILFILFKPRKRVYVSAVAVSLCLCTVMLCAQFDRLHAVTVAGLDTRGGQAAVVYDGRTCMVINCGGADAAEVTAEYLESQGIGRIDLLVLTDEKQSSMSGAEELSRRLEVSRLACAPSAAERAEAVRAESRMEVCSGTLVDAANFELRLEPVPGDGFDAGRLTAELATDTLRFLITGSVAAEVLAGKSGSFDAVLASDYYVNRELPEDTLHEGGLWLMPSWQGIGPETTVEACSQGTTPVDLRKHGNVVFTIR
ncbi:MAG: DUF4131 domain-containing protein [Ruminococcaceae bacterium]|nr:DUF4131 domain-containing protein [Oscillospiraceae bacterium]